MEFNFVTQGGGQEKRRILGGIPDLFGIFKDIFKQLFPKFYLDLVSGQVKVTRQLHYFVFFKWIIWNFRVGTQNVP